MNRLDITIRARSDADSIAEITELLHRAYAKLGAMGLNYTAVDQSPQVIAQRMAGGTCFIALSGGRIVGTVLAQPTHSQSDCDYFTRAGVACVHQFAVEPALQGAGIGRMLLATAETWARDRGFHQVAMDTAEPAMHLVQFYTQLGYLPAGFVQWPGKTYRSVVLAKTLTAPAHAASPKNATTAAAASP